MDAEDDARMSSDKCQRISESPVAVVIIMVFLLCFVYALAYPHEFVDIAVHTRLQDSSPKIHASLCASLASLNLTKPDIESLMEQNRTLSEHVTMLAVTLNRTTQERDNAQSLLASMIEDRKAGPLGTVKVTPTNPTVTPDEFLNPRLSKMLEEVAVRREVLVVLSNKFAQEKLKLWVSHVKRVGIPNYLVIALDDETVAFCEQNDAHVYRRDTDQKIDSIGKSDYAKSISGLKFLVMREFLQLGYGVILSDVDVIHLQNPFNHLYRDCDIESMTDGHDNGTAYGQIEDFIDPDMGRSSIIHTTRLWVYNSGYFYLRPTKPSIELLDRVWTRMDQDPGQWDQDVYNEELFFPSHPGYSGLFASKRSMDIYQFMNSRTLFKFARKDPALRKLLPAVVHVNYHLDKIERMCGVIDFYVNGNETALDPFTDGAF
ncbi:hypothetical protein MLD38_001793 [Melastoma candidum]|uniref:Uncharacterized protein n=2 Tax=Melastoma candidum TaxID=119954 RepID=A0ACB9SDU6_9MYRT|nr:hypothetical protein MLD38_001793 [Melastoma candidum]